MKKPLFHLFVCLIIGILFSYYTRITFVISVTAAACCVIFAAVAYNKNKKTFHLALSLAIIFAGSALFLNTARLSPDNIINYISASSRYAQIKGVIVSDPVYYQTHWGEKRTGFIMKTFEIIINNDIVKTSGRCDVVVSNSSKTYTFSEKILVKGLLKPLPESTNPGQFNYSDLLQNKQVYASLKVGSDNDILLLGEDKAFFMRAKAKLFYLRKIMHNYLVINFSDKQSDFLSALTLGMRYNLPAEIKDYFVKTGTFHILAISGLHIGILSLSLFFIFSLARIPHKTRLLLIIFCLFAYVIISGERISVIRAAIMAVIFLLSRLLNRQADAYSSFSLAGVIILLINPFEILNPGFIMSFICVFSILYFTPKIEQLFVYKTQSRAGKYIKKSITVFLSIYIGLTPLVMYYFHIFSFTSIFVNIAVVFILSFLMPSFLIFALAIFLPQTAAIILSYPVSFFADIIIKIVVFFGKIPFGYFFVPDIPVWIILLYYIILFMWFEKKALRISNRRLIILILVFINICVWHGLIKFQNNLKISFLDVGHGDAIFVEFPRGETMLIDAGSATSFYDNGRSVVVPYIWRRGFTDIDLVVVTHGHLDHFGGIFSVLDFCGVRYLIHNGLNRADEGYDELLKKARKKNVKISKVKYNDQIKGIKDVDILVLNPPFQTQKLSENDTSIVLKITYKNISFLLCADILEEGIKNIMVLKEKLKSNIVKVPHHGSNTGKLANKIFYNFIKPEVAVISCADNYKYKNPSQVILDVLKREKCEIYTTSESGAIEIETDGEKYKLSTTSSVDTH